MKKKITSSDSNFFPYFREKNKMMHKLFTTPQEAVFFSTIKELNKEIHHTKQVDKVSSFENLFKAIYANIGELSSDVDDLFSHVFEQKTEDGKLQFPFFSTKEEERKEEYSLIRQFFVNKLIISCRKSQSIPKFMEDVEKIVFQFYCIGEFLGKVKSEDIHISGKVKSDFNLDKSEHFFGKKNNELEGEASGKWEIINFFERNFHELNCNFDKIYIKEFAFKESGDPKTNELREFIKSNFRINLQRNTLLGTNSFSNYVIKGNTDELEKDIKNPKKYAKLNFEDSGFKENLEKICIRLKESRRNIITEVDVTLQKIKEWQGKRVRLSNFLKERCVAKEKKKTTAFTTIQRLSQQIFLHNQTFITGNRNLLDVMEEFKQTRENLEKLKENIHILNYEMNKYKSLVRHLPFKKYPIQNVPPNMDKVLDLYPNLTQNEIDTPTKKTLFEFELFCSENVSKFISYYSKDNKSKEASIPKCFNRIQEKMGEKSGNRLDQADILQKIRSKITKDEIIKGEEGSFKEVDFEILYDFTTDSHCLLAYNIINHVNKLIEFSDEIMYGFLKRFSDEIEEGASFQEEIKIFLNAKSEKGLNDIIERFRYSKEEFRQGIRDLLKADDINSDSFLEEFSQKISMEKEFRQGIGNLLESGEKKLDNFLEEFGYNKEREFYKETRKLLINKGTQLNNFIKTFKYSKEKDFAKKIKDLLKANDINSNSFLEEFPYNQETEFRKEIKKILNTKNTALNEFFKKFTYSTTYYRKTYIGIQIKDCELYGIESPIFSKGANNNYRNYIEEINHKGFINDINYYCDFVGNYFEEYCNTLDKNNIVDFDTSLIRNEVLRNQLNNYSGFTLEFQKIIYELEKNITEHFIKEVANKETSTIRFRYSRWKSSFFDKIKFDLKQLFLGQYDLLNAYLHSNKFTNTTDSLQVYGGGFGIWDPLQDELVRIQDDRYCDKDYRPQISEHLKNRGERWFSFSERYLDKGVWIKNRLEETIGLSFYSQRKHVNKPEFFTNLASLKNILNVVEKDNSCLFAEDGEVSSFMLLYRFLDGLFHTKNHERKKGQIKNPHSKIGQLFYDIISADSSKKESYLVKENKFITYAIGIAIMIDLTPSEKEKEEKEHKKNNFDILSLIFVLIEHEKNEDRRIENHRIASLLCEVLIKNQVTETTKEFNPIEWTDIEICTTRIRPYERRTSRSILKVLIDLKLISNVKDHEFRELYKENTKNGKSLSFEEVEETLIKILKIEERKNANLNANRGLNAGEIKKLIINNIEKYNEKEKDIEFYIKNITSRLQYFFDLQVKKKKETSSENSNNIIYKLLISPNCSYSYIEIFVKIFNFMRENDDYSTLAKKIQEFEHNIKTGTGENRLEKEGIEMELEVSKYRVKLKYLKLFRRLYFALIYYLVGDVNIHKVDFSFSVKRPNENMVTKGFNPLEDEGRIEKFKTDMARYVNQPELSTSVYSANLISELKRQGLAHGIAKEEANIDITERYVNLCKYVEKELDPEKIQYKTKCGVPLNTLNPLNEEKYFIDRRLAKYEIFKNSKKGTEFFQKREKYLERIRETLAEISSDEKYQIRHLNRFDYYNQITRIIILLLESVEDKFIGKEFTDEFKQEENKANGFNKSWNIIREHIDEMSKFPLDAYYIWRLNNPFALSGLALPLAASGTKKNAPNVGFIILGFRNVFEASNGDKIHITHDTREWFEEYMLTVRAIFQPLIHPLLDRIYYGQIVNKALRENSIHAAVSRVMSRNLSHNMGSHVLDSISNKIFLSDGYKADYCNRPDKISLDEDDCVWLGGELYDENDIQNLASFLRTRMGFIADVSTGKSFFSITYDFKGCFVDFKKVEGNEKDKPKYQRIILDFISGNSAFKNDKIQIFPLVEDQSELNIALPNGSYGIHALNVIIENIIRNSIKHAGYSDSSEYQLAIRITANSFPKNSDYREITIKPEFIKKEDLEGLKLLMSLNEKELEEADLSQKEKGLIEKLKTGNLKSTTRLHQKEFLTPKESKYEESDKKLKQKAEEIIEHSILDDDEIGLREGNWGILEIKIAAAYLRQENLINIDTLSLEKDVPLLKAEAHNDLVSYSFYVPVPKEIEIIFSKDDETKDDKTIKLINGLKKCKKPSNEKKLNNLGLGIRDSLDYKGIELKSEFKVQIIIGNKDDLFGKKTQIQRSRRIIFIDNPDLINTFQRKIHDLTKKENNYSDIKEIIKFAWEERMNNLRELELQEENNKSKELENKEINFKELRFIKSCTKEEGIIYKEGEKVVQLEGYKILFDHHSIYLKKHCPKRQKQGTGKIFPEFYYYEPYESVDPTGLLLENKDLYNKNNRKDEMNIKYEMAESIFSKILIIDERIQREIELEQMPSNALNGKRYKSIMENMGIYLLDEKKLDIAYNNSGKKQFFLDKLNQKIKGIDRLDFVVIHISIIEKLVGTSKKNIEEFIEEEMQLNHAQIVLISERGKPNNLPFGTPFIPYSIVKRFLITQSSKFYLSRILFSATMKTNMKKR